MIPYSLSLAMVCYPVEFDNSCAYRNDRHTVLILGVAKMYRDQKSNFSKMPAYFFIKVQQLLLHSFF